MSNPEILTFGCRLNVYESEVMRDHASKAGLDDAIIVNTCAVTKEAERQARQAIRKARKTNPNAKIIVTGCSAQIDPRTYAQMDEVDLVMGNDLKLQKQSWMDILSPSPDPSLRSDHPLPAGERDGEEHSSEQGEGAFAFKSPKILINDIMQVEETASHLISGFEGHSRAFLQVQNGCDHRCTFCIIPYGRGNSRSVPIGVIADQMRELVQNGYKEVVLTGVDVTSYGPDLPGQPTLGQMIRRVLALVPELPRLRLSSLDPVEIDDDLWDLIKNEPRLMPHLHLSLQAGDDLTLKRMKRRHLRQDVIDVCQKARDLRPDMVFGADIIAGFPTETDQMFENSMRIVEECDLSFLHIFPYSERDGTPAAKMPQVEHAKRKERAAKLRDLGDKQVDRHVRSYVGQELDVLVEKNNIGRTPHFFEVQFKEDIAPGSLVNAHISSIENGKLIGQAKAIQ